MALSFKVKTLSRSRVIKNIFLSSIFFLSFSLILFSKSDYFFVNKLKSISNSYLHPITSFVVAPVKFANNLQNQFYEFRNLKVENNILKEEIMRLKKWQALAVHNSSENRVLKRLLNATDNSLSLVKTASITSRNDFMYSKMININTGIKDGVVNNMAVVNHRGLIGRTVDTSISNARVLLLTDPNSSIAVMTAIEEFGSVNNNTLALLMEVSTVLPIRPLWFTTAMLLTTPSLIPVLILIILLYIKSFLLVIDAVLTKDKLLSVAFRSLFKTLFSELL